MGIHSLHLIFSHGHIDRRLFSSYAPDIQIYFFPPMVHRANSLRALWEGGNAIRRKPRDKEKYHKILDAAIRVFSEQGFYKSTVSKIAKEAGVADGTIYLYFKNKDDILTQFFSYKAKIIYEEIKAAVARGDTAVAKLRNLIQAHLSAHQNDMHFSVVFQSEARHNRRLAEKEIKKISRAYLDMVANIAVQGQQEGTVRSDLPLSMVKHFLLGGIDDVVNTWVLAGSGYDMTDLVDPLLTLFISGVGTNK